MAFPVVESVSTAITDTAGVMTITKPTGLAVGDLMLAWVVTTTGGLNSVPSGFTLVRSASPNGIFHASYQKIADSSDVAASGFAFDNGDTGANFCILGGIARISGPDQTTPISFSNDGTTTTASSSPLSSGITITGRQCLTVILAGGSNTTAVRTTSAYAVVTSNPTWTEDYDVARTGAGTARANIAMAHGNYGGTLGVSTGNATATFSGNNSQSDLQIIAIQPPAIVVTPISGTFSINSVTLFRTMIVTALSFVGSLGVPTVSEVANKWANLTKHSSSWNDQSKTP